jgi:hypothetical protein
LDGFFLERGGDLIGEAEAAICLHLRGDGVQQEGLPGFLGLAAAEQGEGVLTVSKMGCSSWLMAMVSKLRACLAMAAELAA